MSRPFASTCTAPAAHTAGGALVPAVMGPVGNSSVSHRRNVRAWGDDTGATRMMRATPTTRPLVTATVTTATVAATAGPAEVATAHSR